MPRESGSGLLYFLLLAAVAGIVIVGLQRTSQQSITQLRSERLKSVRETIYRRVHNVASSEEAIRQTFIRAQTQGGNTALVNCLTAGQPCSARTPQNMAEFVLNEPGTMRTIAGTASAQVRYDLNGEPCTQAGSCVFDARTYFWATCLGGAPNCQLPERLFTMTQIRYVGSDRRVPVLAHYPSDSDLQTRWGELANSLLVDNILQKMQQCPAGAVLEQIEQDGKVRCRCLGGPGAQIGVDSTTGHPICSTKLCPDTQTFIGLDGNGNAICQSRDMEFNCFRQPFTNNNTVDCGYDSQGQPIRMRGIYNSNTNCSESSGGLIVCDPMEALCCVRRR